MSDKTTIGEEITPDLMIPDLLRAHPLARQVLDKYGLKGCGGPEGPHESLRFFARAHDVDEHSLLCQIEQAIAHESSTVAGSPAKLPTADLGDTIYRRFFVAAILVALSFGATWGALILFKIGAGGYTGVSSHEINAHGQAQIFGWMGLFILGFGYQAFPRFWHTRLQYPKLAVGAFVTMVAGIFTAAAGLWLGNHSAYALPLGFTGSVLELIAVSIFAAQIGITFAGSGKRLEPYIAAIFTACTWFVISSAYNAWHVWNTLSSVPDSQVAWYVSTFQPALRDMQFLGVGMTMVLGVSLRTLPHLYGLPKIASKRAWTALALVTTGVIAQVCVSLAQTAPTSMLRALPPVFWLGGAWLLLSQWKLWRPFPEADRSTKFVQAGYAWLIVSLFMFFSLPFYVAGLHPISAHAFTAASHHAITVGFISLMIMGHAAKVVATLNGVRSDKLTALWGPFILINTGCLLRVVMQILTDWTPRVFPLIGVSGTLEVVALTWWGLHLIKIIVAGKRDEQQSAGAQSEPVKYPLTGDENVAAILDTYPQLLTVFMSHGFTAVASPAMRNTVARRVPLKMACRMHDVSLAGFLDQANAMIAASKTTLGTASAVHATSQQREPEGNHPSNDFSNSSEMGN